MDLDFNILEQRASSLFQSGSQQDALKIYLFMADGDESLDGGYLAQRIAQCYEALGDEHSAKYWYRRALDENPVVRPETSEGLNRVGGVGIDDLL